MPSAQTYTGSRSSSRRRFHVSYSACQLAFSRAIDAADSGAAAPRQPSQRQIEVPVGQPVQVQLGQEPAHFLRPPLEQRQQPTLEARLQPPHPRPPHRDRPAHETEPARLPEAVPVARRRVHPLPPLLAPPAQDLLHLLLEQLLDTREKRQGSTHQK